jgi:hypothetical protein
MLVSIYASQCIHILMQVLGYAHSAPRGVTLPEDVASREAYRINNERLWEQRLRCVEGDEELTCSQVISMDKLLHDTLALVGWDVLHPPWVSLKERKKRLACAPLAPFEFPQFSPSLILQHLS